MRANVYFLTLLACALAGSASSQTLETRGFTSSDPALKGRTVILPSGKNLETSVGIGSAAFRHHSDAPNVFWTAGDRGPNMTCAEAPAILGDDVAAMCRKLVNGRV